MQKAELRISVSKCSNIPNNEHNLICVDVCFVFVPFQISHHEVAADEVVEVDAVLVVVAAEDSEAVVDVAGLEVEAEVDSVAAEVVVDEVPHEVVVVHLVVEDAVSHFI